MSGVPRRPCWMSSHVKPARDVRLFRCRKYNAAFFRRFAISMKIVQREMQNAANRVAVLHSDTEKAQKIGNFPQLCTGFSDSVLDRFDDRFRKHYFAMARVMNSSVTSTDRIT